MVRIGRFRLDSLAARLGLAALAGFGLPALLTALLMLTAQGASDVVGAARRTHDRVSLYIQIEEAAGTYQRLSYALSGDNSLESRRQVAQARTRFENLLAAARRLPLTDERDGRMRERIADQGRLALIHAQDSDRLVAGVDRAWHEGGSRAALAEVGRISQPFQQLKQMLQAEIRRGGSIASRDVRDAQALIDLAVAAAVVALVIAALFSLLLQLLLQWRLRPALERLEEGARAFGEGDLAHRIRLAGEDELSHLSNAFDRMAQALAEKQDALGQIREGLEQAVATSTAELRRANAELSAVDERRRAFLADISHELRTPLTVIRGEAQVAMRLAERPDFDPHDTFERILKQTQDLSRMVADLFLIARAQAGGLPLELELLDLRDLARDAAGDFETLATMLGASISAAPGPPVLTRVDAGRMRRALAALVENALRHCQAGVRIELDVWIDSTSASIAVCDDGPGVDFAHAERLFERFRRGESRGEGSGLGLSLVEALVAAHGGRTRLLPAAGGGTRAVLQLPLGEARREAA